MRPISQRVKNILLHDDFYKTCIRHKEGTCKGRITWEHAFIYGGRQLDEHWAIVPLCAYHHAVDGFQDMGDYDRAFGQYCALKRATKEDLKKYPRENWEQKKAFLASKYEGA